MRFRNTHAVWLATLALILAGAVWWIIDSKSYDDDLEAQHYAETGLYWE